MSLRTRLWLVALLAAGALVVVVFVAWRLARATEAFAAQQAEWTLHTATSALANEIRMHPQGRTESPDTLSGEPPAPRHPRPPVPPHEREILRRYSDPFERSGAIALHRFPEARGGFLHADASSGVTLANEEIALVQRLASEALRSGEAARGEAQTATGRALFKVVPVAWSDEGAVRNSNGEAGSERIVAAWARVQLPKGVGTSDWLNVVALLLLLASVSLIVLFTWTTLRVLDGDVSGMRQGLRALAGNLDEALPAPHTPELRPVAGAINELATDLRRSVEQRQALQLEMARHERLVALGRVVAGVAHEVRNPLAAMRLKMQTTRRANFPREKLERTFAVVIEEIDRLDALVRRLLELGRPAALHRTQFDVCELARERAALVAEIAARQSVDLRVCETQTKEARARVSPAQTNASNGACLLSADRERLAQVFDNLFRNALDAMGSGGTLTVTCAPTTEGKRGDSPASVRVSVSDTGAGVASELRAHLFEPFQTDRAEGTGLGLAIAREIVEAHDGTIRLANDLTTEGQDAKALGATFIIELPTTATEGEVAGVDQHLPQSERQSNQA